MHGNLLPLHDLVFSTCDKTVKDDIAVRMLLVVAATAMTMTDDNDDGDYRDRENDEDNEDYDDSIC